MTDVFVGEKGKTVYVGTDFDISSATNIEIHFSAPAGGLSFVNSVSVSALGANFTTTACGVLSANKAAVYVLNSGDFSGSVSGDPSGTWKGWLVCDFGAATRLISSSFKFKVDNPG
jgi:hypothetical protein